MVDDGQLSCFSTVIRVACLGKLVQCAGESLWVGPKSAPPPPARCSNTQVLALRSLSLASMVLA